jgi:hypothetical protein
MRSVITITTIGLAVLMLVIGTVIQLTARTVGPVPTTASDVGLAVSTVAVIALAALTPIGLRAGYDWAHDRGVGSRRRYDRYDAALPRDNTADVLPLGTRTKQQ